MLYIRAHQLFKTNETKTLHKVGSRVYSEGIHPRVNPFGVYESAIACTREWLMNQHHLINYNSKRIEGLMA